MCIAAALVTAPGQSSRRRPSFQLCEITLQLLKAGRHVHLARHSLVERTGSNGCHHPIVPPPCPLPLPGLRLAPGLIRSFLCRSQIARSATHPRPELPPSVRTPILLACPSSPKLRPPFPQGMARSRTRASIVFSGSAIFSLFAMQGYNRGEQIRQPALPRGGRSSSGLTGEGGMPPLGFGASMYSKSGSSFQGPRSSSP